MNKVDPKLVKQFNQPDTVLIISKYPYKNIENSYHGVATYTQNVLRDITKKTNQRFVVLVQAEYDRLVEIDGENILIIPAFGAGLEMFPQLLQHVLSFNKVKKIHIHSEFFTSGKPLQMALVVPFLASLRTLGKELSYFAHNVVDDYSFIANHLGKKSTDASLKILQALTPAYYWCLSHAVKEIVVLDESVKNRLSKSVSDSKILTTPHWIHAKKMNLGKRDLLRKKYDFKQHDFVIVCFGFMTKYKGVDWLVDAVQHMRKSSQGKKVKLILAGGKAPSQEGKAHYEKFYSQLAQKVAKSTSLVLTGFIPQDEVHQYFAMADVVILPYRGILGASGSWAQAMAHGTPFLLSEDLAPYLESEDVQIGLEKYHLITEDLIFKRHKSNLAKKIFSLMENKKLAQMTDLSKYIAEVRSPEQRLQIENTLLYSPQESQISLQWSRVTNVIKKLQPSFAS